MHTRPARIFGLPLQEETFVEIDPEARWDVHAAEMFSRCGWTPFEGMALRGRVQRVVLRGRDAYAGGRVLALPGSGRVHRPEPMETILEEA